MRLTSTPIAGAYVVEPEPHTDERGFFARVWCVDELKPYGIVAGFRQCNTSYTRHRGTVRGLHYQVAPFEEIKLMRCIRGRAFDVIVDVRDESPTRGEWFGIELSAENRRMLLVPAGMAHGFQTLEDDTEVLYPVSQPYHATAERGVRWNDPRVGVRWPIADHVIVSPKDESWPDFT
jgi:dTDP-4-dehydrorhamnose 3,5-epimerase